MSLVVDQVMALAPVIPVLVVDRVEDAVPLAQALVAGGLPALEVTMRTPIALEVMREMAIVFSLVLESIDRVGPNGCVPLSCG